MFANDRKDLYSHPSNFSSYYVDIMPFNPRLGVKMFVPETWNFYDT
jgi:hypothetical protein